MRDHTATPLGKCDIPAFTTQKVVGLLFSDPEGMKGWVDVVGWLHTVMVYLPENGNPSPKITRVSSLIRRTTLPTATPRHAAHLNWTKQWQNKTVIDRRLRLLWCHLWDYFKHTSLCCRYIRMDITCKHNVIKHAHCGLVRPHCKK